MRPNTRLLIATATWLTALCANPLAHAAPQPYTGPDYSGTYDCKGQDDHEGPYTGEVTLQRVPSQSSGPYGAYRFQLDVPGYGSYLGQAAGKGPVLAIHFALTDPSTRDYGTGIAEFKRIKAGKHDGKSGGKWAFRKYYYEPEFKGGNFGIEDCVQR